MSKRSLVRPAQIISQGRESASPEDLNLQYLLIELARLDVLLRRQVLLWQRAGQDPADAFRGLYISDAEVDRLLARPPGSNWGDLVRLEQEQQAAFAAEEDGLQRAAEGMREIARQAGVELRLERLCRVFKLTAFEREVFLVCLAPMLDPRYERLYGYLQDDVTRKMPGVDLVLALLCSTSRERFACWANFTPEAALFKNRLLEYAPDKRQGSLLSQNLAADATVLSWLLGAYRPDLRLVPGMHLDGAVAEIDPQVCGEKIWECIQADQDDLPILSFYGMDRLGQKNAARALAGRFELPLITFDLEVWEPDELTLETALQFALRDARMLGAILFITGVDKILGENGQPLQRRMTDLIHYPGVLILASRTPWQVKSRDHERRILWFDFPIPDFSQRRQLWTDFSKMDERGLSEIAGHFQLTSAQIRDACASARDAAAQCGEALNLSHLFAAARAHSNPRLANLARKIQPRYTWQDIILPDDQLRLLREIVATVRGRPRVLDEWGVGLKLASSRGVTVLFAGPPGTGKTMAAEVIAADLKLDLYKIDLATVVSKYIGETEKNLERIFVEAEMSNAILFFDEADALFGKRSEVRDSHDRYANIEISYLLQRMEAYDGVTILATNLGANLDEAFKRRLGFAVEFPFPEADYRNRIWKTLFPEQVPRDATIDWDWLADRLRLAGGNIRNIIVNAAYLAASDGGVVGMKHLQHSARRELQKMGRLITEDDLNHE